MLDEEARLSKNQSIKQAIKETHEKRKSQVCRVYKVKIDQSSLSVKQHEQIKRLFIEAKWLWNDIIGWCHLSEDNKPWNYQIGKEVRVKLPDNTFEVRSLSVITAQMKQEVLKQICSNIKTLSTLKKKGLQQPGLIKFKSEVNKVHIKQLQKNFIRRNNKFMKIPGIHGDVRVNGLEQFCNIDGIDYACAELLNTPSGYYVTITTYTNKENIKSKEKIQEILGIDFGCQTNFTLSTGEKINCIVEETERLKILQRRLARQVKGSNNYKRTAHLIRVQYQKISNKKNDLANKLVHDFLKYETVVIQDEQLANWQKGNHGKAIQHSVMGRVKSKLMKSDQVVVLDRFTPTTKLCVQCGQYHDDLKLWDRQFICDCGVSEDRDVHAAKNMIWLYEHNVGVGRTKLKRVELEAMLKDFSVTEAMNHEGPNS